VLYVNVPLGQDHPVTARAPPVARPLTGSGRPPATRAAWARGSGHPARITGHA